MSFKRFYPITVGCVLAVLMSIAPAVLGQVTTTQTTQNPNMTLRSVPSGSKMKFRGVVISRDADVFTIRDTTPCPTCGAEAGKRCHDDGGFTMAFLHPARMDAAQ